MPDHMSTLNAYLREAGSQVDGDHAVRVVIGNEAADLDSMVSAIMYAFGASHGERGAAARFIPVINIPRTDFILRTEAVYLFRVLGLDVSALMFIDEIDLEALHHRNRLKLTLVDHNLLASGQTRYADAVEAIIDHHADAGHYLLAAPRTIEPVGSAATLVTEAILRTQAALVDARTATLLLGTILLDTVNLSPAAMRATPKDEQIVARLVALAEVDPKALFETLQAEKFSVSSLSTEDLLRKDYKEWQAGSLRYGVSSVATSLKSWIAQDADLVKNLEGYRRSRDLQCLLAMLAYSDAEQVFRRELAIVVPEEALLERLLVPLTRTLGLSRCQQVGDQPSDGVAFFSQGKASESRKTLQPVLQQFFVDSGMG